MNNKSKHTSRNELRTYSVNILFNLYELQEIDMLREKKARATYIRSVFFNKVPPPVPEINRSAYIELSKYANDIHHISEMVNDVENIEFDELKFLLHEFRIILLAGMDKS